MRDVSGVAMVPWLRYTEQHPTHGVHEPDSVQARARAHTVCAVHLDCVCDQERRAATVHSRREHRVMLEARPACSCARTPHAHPLRNSHGSTRLREMRRGAGRYTPVERLLSEQQA